MNKNSLVEQIATRSDIPKKDAHNALTVMIETISQELSQGETIQLVGFGTFKVSHRAERKGRNPKTGEEITIPQRNVPIFSPGKALKNACNG